MKIPREIKYSQTLQFTNEAKAKKSKGEKIISLGLGEPIFETPKEIVQSTYKAIKNGYTKYSNPYGLKELRELIKEELLRENNIDVSINNIIVTPGAKPALFLSLMAILEPNDEIILFTPCYVSYIPQIRLAEPKAVIKNIDLLKENFSIDWKRLKNNFSKKTKAILLNFPHNPTGKILNDGEFKDLIEFLMENACYIISDEVYEKLNFSKIPHYSPASIKKLRDRVITINGFSKAYSMTGWRIGYLVANKDLTRTISKLNQHINANTCTFIQKGVCSAFSLSSNFLSEYKEGLKKKAKFMYNILSKNKRLDIIPPRGGLFSFLNISKTGMNSDNSPQTY